MRYATVTMVVLAGLLIPGAVRAETLEEVEKKITDMQTKHKSVEMKMKTKTDLKMEQMTEKSEAESMVIYAKKGDKWLSRNETKATGTRKVADQPEEKVETKMLVISDGDHVYTLIQSPQYTQAMKQKTGKMEQFGKELWESMHKHMDVKLLPDETIEGKSAWVMEMRPKPDAEATPEAKAMLKNTRTLVYYRKSDGAAVKSVTYDKDQPTVTMTLHDVKYDVEPKPDAFKFTPPEGVTVMDMDALNEGQGAQDGEQNAAPAESTETKAEEKPQEEAKPKEEPKQEEKPQQQEEPKKEKGVKGLLKKLR